MSDTIEQSFWYKVRYTPIRDALRGKMTARLDPRPQLERAALPPQVKESLRRVVKATRLWRLERVEVLNELIAHFTDGLAAGISADELLQRFGDEVQAAKLIRRAKRRNRPMAWHALRFAGWSMMGLLVFYLAYAVYFFAGHPSPRINYVANINHTIENTPIADRAWPLYRRAMIGMDANSWHWQSLLTRLDALTATNGRRELLDLIRKHEAEVKWIRQEPPNPGSAG